MFMSRITFQKRQKEMKRMEKQKMKAERRAQRKIAKNSEPADGEAQPEILGQDETLMPSQSVPSEGEQ
jgi:hypothetical protein